MDVFFAFTCDQFLDFVHCPSIFIVYFDKFDWVSDVYVPAGWGEDAFNVLGRVVGWDVGTDVDRKISDEKLPIVHLKIANLAFFNFVIVPKFDFWKR